MQVRNTFIIFLVSGFWHGANWTFVVWGALNALYFLPLLLMDRNRRNLGAVAAQRWWPSPTEVWQMGTTFLLTCVAWVFFRAPDMGTAMAYLGGMFSSSLLDKPSVELGPLALLIVLFIAVEWAGRHGQHALEELGLKWPAPLRWSAYATLIFLMGMFLRTEETPFIYFQF